ncbi:MAG: TonB-dependent receptor [Aquificaceae bacterium]|uniref:TonB-dependent receptor n=1 Tax=Hydrogenobacter sp. Uz 6-8 TaxID=3384828 RepID=UPI0030ACD217
MRGKILLLLGISGLSYAQSLEVQEVSVTATRLERKTEDVPSSVKVVGEERIKETKMFNLQEALSGVPGVFIQSRNQGYDTRLILRGSGLQAPYGVRQIMILLNGIPITDPDSLTRLDFVDTQLVKSIEVNKGPNPLWGVNSAGGVISVQTISPFERKGGILKVGGGDFGTFYSHLNYTKSLENFYFTFSASRRQTDNSWRPWNKFWTNQITLQPAYMFSDGTTVESYLGYTRASLQLPGALVVDPVRRIDQWTTFKETGDVQQTADPWRHMGRYSEIWFFNTRLTKNIGSLELKPVFWLNHWTHYHPVTGRINDADTWIYGADLQGNYKNTFGVLIVGFTLRHDEQKTKYYRYADVQVAGNPPRIISTLSDRAGDLLERQNQKTTLYGFYLQQSFTFNKLILDVGARFDTVKFDIWGYKWGDYDFSTGNYRSCPSPSMENCFDYSREKTYNSVNPKVGLVYRLYEGVNLYATYARGAQTPTSSELSSNPALKMAKVENYEAGVKLRKGMLSMDTAFYFSPVKDEVVRYFEDGITKFINAGKTERKGFELDVNLSPLHGLSLGAGYSYQHYTFKRFYEPVRIGNQTVNLDRSGKRLPYIPEHYYSLYAMYKHPSGFKVRVQSDTWGSYYIDNANSEKYGGYSFITSLMLGYEKGRWDFALNADNLFDKRYAVEVTKDTSADPSTARKRYTPAPPRTFTVRVSYQF